MLILHVFIFFLNFYLHLSNLINPELEDIFLIFVNFDIKLTNIKNFFKCNEKN